MCMQPSRGHDIFALYLIRVKPVDIDRLVLEYIRVLMISSMESNKSNALKVRYTNCIIQQKWMHFGNGMHFGGM